MDDLIPVPRVAGSSLLLQVCVALLALGGANLLIARMARNSVPRQLIRQIDFNRDANFLATGNSLVAAAFDEDIFHGAWNSTLPLAPDNIKPLNMALGASGTVEELLLLRHALAVNASANVIVFGFFNQMLTEHPTGGWEDLTGNRAMSYYVEPYFAADLYAPQSRLQMIQMGLVGHVPMLVERLTLWAKVEKIRRKYADIGMPHEQSTQFGRASDFQDMEVKDDSAFRKICQQCADQNLPFAPSVEQMIEISHQHHAQFIIIEMPMPMDHRKTTYGSPEWHAYERHLQDLSRQDDALFLNASDWLPDAHFADVLHANAQGRADFSTRLAAELKPILMAHRADSSR